jgi:predicted lipoprotein with Yx(FWY)xxD motif
MKRACFSLVTIGVIVAFSGCSGGSSTSRTGGGASTPTRAPASLTVRTVTPLGQILVDGSGRTLYLFEADSTKAATCSRACAQAWPPFLTSGSPHVGSGVTQSLLGTMTRSDGTRQVTYNGHPLYYFADDTKPGNTNGEGLTSFGAGWDAVSPAGNKIERPGG